MMSEKNIAVMGAGYWGKKHVDEYTQIGAEVLVADLSEKNLKEVVITEENIVQGADPILVYRSASEHVAANDDTVGNTERDFGTGSSK